MTTPIHGTSWPSRSQLNPVSFDHVSAFAETFWHAAEPGFPSTTFLPSLTTLLAHSWTQFFSLTPFLPSLTTFPARRCTRFLQWPRSYLRWQPFQPATEPSFSADFVLLSLSLFPARCWTLPSLSILQLPLSTCRIHLPRSTRRAARKTPAIPSTNFEPIPTLNTEFIFCVWFA